MNVKSKDAQRRANVRFHQIGKGLPRIDAPGKVTGKTKYAGDFVCRECCMPKCLEALKPVRL